MNYREILINRVPLVFLKLKAVNDLNIDSFEQPQKISELCKEYARKVPPPIFRGRKFSVVTNVQ